MSININLNYSQFYQGMQQIQNYGSGTGTVSKKDTLVKYEFNTTDKNGNRVMDKLSREETLQVMNDITAQYGDNVIVEFSGDGLAALAECKKGIMDRPLSQEEMEAKAEKDAAFEKEIVHFDRSANYLPEYSGLYGADKAVATAVEKSSREEQAFVYNIIRQNFLIENSSSMTEEERQANISLGMKKAEYAAENFISEGNRKSFLKAMESIAKLASAGKADKNGNMDYGVNKPSYLGHGSNLTYTTNTVDMMRTMDSSAYEEYQRISNRNDGALDSLKYLTNWYINSVKKNPSMVDTYERQTNDYVEKNIQNRKLNTTFDEIRTENKSVFLESLRAFQSKNPNFLSAVLNSELKRKFWGM